MMPLAPYPLASTFRNELACSVLHFAAILGDQPVLIDRHRAAEIHRKCLYGILADPDPGDSPAARVTVENQNYAQGPLRLQNKEPLTYTLPLALSIVGSPSL
jgi:hypothetical protein